MKPRTHLLIIDPQNDFCDLPEAYRPRMGPMSEPATPALAVAGAHADMQRLAAFMTAATPALDAITVTLDSHHRLDIAHPGFWRGSNGAPVPPFTTITEAQLRAGHFQPADPAALPRALDYLNALEARGRYTLMVWPVHCELGSWGHNVHADVRSAYNAWEEQRGASVAKVIKGTNPWTEHYSALQAEVPDAADPATQLNAELIASLDQAEQLFIAGEASSHCVRATTEHIVEHLPGRRLERITLLTDCMSPVAGFEAQHDEFLAAMRARGVQLLSNAAALDRLHAARS
jgi:nicotinamidase-related amidase